MKLIVGSAGGSTSVYVVRGEDAYDLSVAFPGIGQDLSALIEDAGLMQAVAAAGDLGAPVPVGAITPALPVARPDAIICLGLNYVEHIKEGGYDIPDYPALFMRSRSSIMAAGAPMVRPACSEKLDYEAELMLIIGKGGRHISREDALDHVFGYTVFNDGSVRDYQRKTHQWT
jgi:2-keto-4-pentenoate hydratase/2-oxohepta-3-ene-1,7-dioic acid hydratase in catechol pathway